MIPRQPRTRPADTDDRFERLEKRVDRLERTLTAVASEAADVSIAGPCPGCRRSLLLVREGMFECPCCAYRRPL